MGADLVGKVEAGIPEDDPRNPAVIADNVGDNVGDVAGMGADLFESYVGSIIAAIALASAAVVSIPGQDWKSDVALLPLLLAGFGIAASILGTFIVRSGERASFGDLLWALRRGIFASALLVVGFAAIAVVWLDLDGLIGPTVSDFDIFWAIVAGLGAGVIIGLITEYYTSYDYGPTKAVAESSQTGSATTMISGIATGMQSTVVPVLIIVGAILAAFELAGFYGVALAGVGMLSTLGITLATDAYGPVADNAGGIAEQAQLAPEVRERTDALDALGNTTAATGKGFAIGSAGLTSLALLAAFGQAADLNRIDLLTHTTLTGLLIGAMLPFLFSAMTMRAVGRAAFSIVNEVRRQFREIAGIMDGTGRPEYAKCVEISTTGRPQRDDHSRHYGCGRASDCRFRAGRRSPGRPAHRSRGRRLRPRHYHGQRRRGLGQRQEIHRAGQLRRQGFRRPQGSGRRRCGGRSVQGHLRPVAEHPAQAHGHRVASVRAPLPGAGRPHRQDLEASGVRPVPWAKM